MHRSTYICMYSLTWIFQNFKGSYGSVTWNGRDIVRRTCTYWYNVLNEINEHQYAKRNGIYLLISNSSMHIVGKHYSSLNLYSGLEKTMQLSHEVRELNWLTSWRFNTNNLFNFRQCSLTEKHKYSLQEWMCSVNYECLTILVVSKWLM